MNESSIAHIKWNCKYHIVFTSKFRRKAIYGQLKADIGKILRELCTWKEVEIIEAIAECVRNQEIKFIIKQGIGWGYCEWRKLVMRNSFRVLMGVDYCQSSIMVSLKSGLIISIVLSKQLQQRLNLMCVSSYFEP